MSEKDWLDMATEKIRFGPDRKAVRRELEAHLEDLRETSGLESEAALRAMGDPGAIAEELGRLHSPWPGYLWRTSQVILIGTAAVYCLILAVLFVDSGRSYLFPGRMLYNYLNWDGRGILELEEIQDERELSSSQTVKTGGVTIRVDRATLYRTAENESQWNLYLDIFVNLGWQGDRLDIFAISDVRDSAGTCKWYGASTHWAYWQKIAFAVPNLPEDAEWVELDFGYGKLRRTLHIDLTEEAGA
ncbi:MAG: hypothetical protein K2N78_02125 [Oscillospiraceae bacterium]|nr:hypothetical protein [Oscillospiraceae bacterium]